MMSNNEQPGVPEQPEGLPQQPPAPAAQPEAPQQPAAPAAQPQQPAFPAQGAPVPPQGAPGFPQQGAPVPPQQPAFPAQGAPVPPQGAPGFPQQGAPVPPQQPYAQPGYQQQPYGAQPPAGPQDFWSRIGGKPQKPIDWLPLALPALGLLAFIGLFLPAASIGIYGSGNFAQGGYGVLLIIGTLALIGLGIAALLMPLPWAPLAAAGVAVLVGLFALIGSLQVISSPLTVGFGAFFMLLIGILLIAAGGIVLALKIKAMQQPPA